MSTVSLDMTHPEIASSDWQSPSCEPTRLTHVDGNVGRHGKVDVQEDTKPLRQWFRRALVRMFVSNDEAFT